MTTRMNPAIPRIAPLLLAADPHRPSGHRRGGEPAKGLALYKPQVVLPTERCVLLIGRRVGLQILLDECYQ